MPVREKDHSSSQQKCQLHRMQCGSENISHFPYQPGPVPSALSEDSYLSHLVLPWEIPACHSNPSSGVSSSSICLQIHNSPNTSNAASLLHLLKSVLLSHRKVTIQVSTEQSLASHLYVFLSLHLELKTTAIPNSY